jgi:iron complex outermembrane recepter protein
MNVRFDATDFLSFAGQATYLDATYSSFCEPITAGSPQGDNPLCDTGFADRSGNRLNQAPEWSGGVNLNIHLPVGNRGELTADVSYSWESNIFFTPPNDALVASGGWGRLDARIGFPLFEEAEVYVFGKNLQDERYISYSGRASPLLVQAGLNDPRNYGLGFRYHF